MISARPSRRRVVEVLVGGAWANGVLSGNAGATAQSLSIMPTSIFLQPTEQATLLKLTNRGSTETSIQLRAFAWSQDESGQDQLEPTDLIAVSPPIATVPAAGAQTIRLLLRRTPTAREATYRILVDQIPSVNQTEQIRVALRLSLPVFAQPEGRSSAEPLRYELERVGDALDLVATNPGVRHDMLSDIQLKISSGATLSPGTGGSPYILARSTRRWRLTTRSPLPHPGQAVRLVATARHEGLIDQMLTVSAAA